VNVLPAAGTLWGEAVRAALLALGFGLFAFAIERWYQRSHPPVEWTRKTLHVGFGLVAAALPWIITSHWTLLALGLFIVVPLQVARRRGWLASLFNVERPSLGELYFPLGVYLLFVAAAEHRVFYIISLITLVLCDAFAAVLGDAYGRNRYRVHREQRSLEGSAVFFLTAFLGTHIPLLLFTPIDRGASVMISLQIALLVTSFEAISPGGSDNLVLPLGAYYLLVKLTPKTSASIGLQLAAQVGILVAMLVFAKRTRFLTFSGALAMHLVLYSAFSLGGPMWVVAPVLALALLLALDRAHHRRLASASEGHDVRTIFYAGIVATLWLFADNAFATLLPAPGALGKGHPFHVLFVSALAAALTVVASWTFSNMPRFRRRSPFVRGAAALLLAFVGVAWPGLWVLRGEQMTRELGVAVLACVAALFADALLRRVLQRVTAGTDGLRRLALGVLLATLAVLPLHLWWQGLSTRDLVP